MAISPHVARLRAAVGHELLVLPSACGVVFDAEGRILLVRHTNGGIWSFPGGCIDPCEAPADAVAREIWEETGLYAVPVRVLGVFGGPDCVVAYANGDRTSYVVTAFECEVRGGELRACSDETDAAAFVGPGELDGYRASPLVRQVLPRLFERPREALFAAPSWKPPA